MKKITVDDLLNQFLGQITYLNKEEQEKVKQSYIFASNKHVGQKRKSGEPYIIHPLFVAYILSKLKADKDTLCAALLHDVVEDTDTTLEEIEIRFGKDVRILVDAVTKLKSDNFTKKEDKNMANTRKIFTSMKIDPRAILIKLADRLHNMLTLEYHDKVEKQIENSQETMDLFVPVASILGISEIAEKLSELAMKYLEKEYENLVAWRKISIELAAKELEENIEKIKQILAKTPLDFDIQSDYRSLYSMSKINNKSINLPLKENLCRIRIILNSTKECYAALKEISNIQMIDEATIRDYLHEPKTNFYQSLDCSFNSNTKLQIRTTSMDKIDKLGIAAYWELYPGHAKEKMREALSTSEFYSSLISSDEYFEQDNDFVRNLQKCLLKDTTFPIIRYSESEPRDSKLVQKILQFYENPSIVTTTINLGIPPLENPKIKLYT